MVLKMKFKTHHGVLQLCVSVSETAPSLWNILSTARLVPIECPDSTLIKLAIRFSAWASIRPETELKIMSWIYIFKHSFLILLIVITFSWNSSFKWIVDFYWFDRENLVHDHHWCYRKPPNSKWQRTNSFLVWSRIESCPWWWWL